MSKAQNLLSLIERNVDIGSYRDLNWTGSFSQYLEIVAENPGVARNAFQRIYDMILSWGTVDYVRHKEKMTHYKFFDDPIGGGKDAIYGLDRALMRLVNVLKAAAHNYGTERRVLLLHGPVGSSKSTIARLLKKGIEQYSRQPAGALYTFGWFDEKTKEYVDCPMHEEPLRLIPEEFRDKIIAEINSAVREGAYRLEISGDLCPSCRMNYRELLKKYGGDWWRVVEHVQVRRLVLSEKDRVGVGTFQPKDEKNQDSTELTGDINYRKIAEFGSDSDPRAFNFDGEFNIANRGLIEFIEILKLDVAFLYDLLGATQEHKIKPKKFAQTDIDEVIIGHSVAGDTPILYRRDGAPAWGTLASMYERFEGDASGLEVLAYDFAAHKARWTRVRRVIRHKFTGEMIVTSQDFGAVETTPNHSIYDREGRTFFPHERHTVMAVRRVSESMVAGGAAAEAIDIAEGIEGFVREKVAATSFLGPVSRSCRPGYARLLASRDATEVRAVYDPITDEAALRDLLTVLVRYATDGRGNGQNGGVVISGAKREDLERVRAAYARIAWAEGSSDAGAQVDSAGRLHLGSEAFSALARHHCGERAAQKRLPDFLFRLPRPLLQHAFDEIVRTRGSCDFETISPLFAAQIGTLATLLEKDYRVERRERAGGPPLYRVHFSSGEGTRGGRAESVEGQIYARRATDEWVYDIECEGLHNFICGVGNIVCHNTNEPEYKKLQTNELMEAFRDRTVKIDIPYITTLDDEIKIYLKDFNPKKVQGKHIAPHTIEMASMWAILTRLEEPKKAQLSLLQKLKLYNGKTLPGFTEDNIKELREEAPREGMEGISPRYIQDKISNALVSDLSEACVNPFMVLNELEEGLSHHSLITSEDQRKRYKELLAVVKEEYEDIVKNEVQRAISADEEAIARLCANYVDNIKAYTQKEKVKNRYTGQDEEPDERLMRSIEEKIDIPESRKDDFRREIMNYIGALAIDGKQFNYWTNERLQKALELKMFEDQKDSIKLTSLVSSVIDKDTQEKIDVVKSRLIKNYGYCDICATDVLNYVASIFARGDVKAKK
jgi:serine protein kinase